MSLFPGPQESTFWYDFESLTDNNLWKDQGPHSLHATPQAGFSSPAYGLSRTIRGKGYATFTGAANCYATLPLRFYDVAPTQQATLVFAAQYGTQAANGMIFSTYTAGRGLMAYFVGTSRVNIYCADAGGVTSQSIDPAGMQYEGWTRTSVWSINRPMLAGYGWQDGKQYAPGLVGNTNPIAYNAAWAPGLGASLAGLSLFIGQMFFAALFPFVFSNQQAKAMSDWLRNSGM